MSSTLQPFNTILWASGGGINDHQILDDVGELCDHYGCELRIVHVVQTILTQPMPQLHLHEGGERAIAGSRPEPGRCAYKGLTRRCT